VFSNGLSKSARKRVELAVAVAQDKLNSEHVDHALDLVGFVDDDVSFIDALGIYTRLMRLSPEDAQNVRTRALATLGQQVSEEGEWPLGAEPESQEEDAPSGRSWFRQITNRMRGRENEELRRRIELVAARAEVALLWTHVDNALDFAAFLDEEEDIDDQKAVELYLDSLGVRDSIAEVTYYLALAKLADVVLPPHRAAGDRNTAERAPLAVEKATVGQAR
jgi:hypothetical protein